MSQIYALVVASHRKVKYPMAVQVRNIILAYHRDDHNRARNELVAIYGKCDTDCGIVGVDKPATPIAQNHSVAPFPSMLVSNAAENKHSISMTRCDGYSFDVLTDSWLPRKMLLSILTVSLQLRLTPSVP
jgi:hypothetical protein